MLIQYRTIPRTDIVAPISMDLEEASNFVEKGAKLAWALLLNLAEQTLVFPGRASGVEHSMAQPGLSSLTTFQKPGCHLSYHFSIPKPWVGGSEVSASLRSNV